jgi:hypothetical protein
MSIEYRYGFTQEHTFEQHMRVLRSLNAAPGTPAFELYGLMKKVTVAVPMLPVLCCTAVMSAW